MNPTLTAIREKHDHGSNQVAFECSDNLCSKCNPNVAIFLDELITHVYTTAIEEARKAKDEAMAIHCSVTVRGELKYWNSDEYGENPAQDKFFPQRIREEIDTALKALLDK